jgi:centractin
MYLVSTPIAVQVLLTEAPLSSRTQRERAAACFFESLHVPALCISPAPPLALYASGRTTGLVLDVGDGVSAATPVYEGFTQA